MNEIHCCAFCRGVIGKVILAGMVCSVAGGQVVSQATAADKPPATVAEAAKVLDLRTCAVLDGATFPGGRTVARLSYEAKGTVEQAYAFHVQSLTKSGWKEIKGGYVSPQAASGTLACDGYKVSVTVMPASQPAMVNVSLINHGNVDTAKLPVPADSAPFYGSPVTTAYLLSTPVPAVAEKVSGQLTAQGWQPYGEAGDVRYFKLQAVRLGARVTSAPAQGGKTVVEYSTELMSADLPAPPNANRVQYADVVKQLSFDAPTALADVEAFYRQSLASDAWKATTESAVVTDFVSMVLFRNPQQDMLMLKLRTVDDITRGELQFLTAEEVLALEKTSEAKPLVEAETPARTGPRVEVPLPAAAQDVEVADDSIEFSVAAGKGLTTVASLRKHYQSVGWKEESASLDKMAGNVTFAKGAGILTITYVDTGLESARITVLGMGAKLLRKTAGKKSELVGAVIPLGPRGCRGIPNLAK